MCTARRVLVAVGDAYKTINSAPLETQAYSTAKREQVCATPQHIMTRRLGGTQAPGAQNEHLKIEAYRRKENEIRFVY